ncbi:MAG: hypothetical protein JWM82_4129 [Myxococcales bacterium]|nr:hypothetical protein [Myxococcales bacterium]
MGLDVVRQLGADLDRRWQAADYDPRQFSDMAVAALAAADLPGRVAPDEVIDWVLAADTLPRQMNLPATFGQPPVTLFCAKRFYIEALFWLDGSTSIHQHAFSGAFLVLSGSSIETRYSFVTEREWDGRFVTGKLAVESTALLRRGDIRPIASGRGRLVHSLFHLERPSLTLVVRTYRDADAGPQFDFARPGIGVDPFFKEETVDRMLEVVRLLRHLEDPSFEARVGGLVARSDVHTAYRVLSDCLGLADRALFDRLVGNVRDRDARTLMRLAFDERRRIAYLVTRRAHVRDAELRFFLGALLNTQHRRDLLALARARAPEVEPATLVARWVRQLAGMSVKLQASGAPWQPNLFGLPEMNDGHEAALAAHLAGREEPSDGAESPFMSELRQVRALAPLFG